MVRYLGFFALHALAVAIVLVLHDPLLPLVAIAAALPWWCAAWGRGWPARRVFWLGPGAVSVLLLAALLHDCGSDDIAASILYPLLVVTGVLVYAVYAMRIIERGHARA